MRTIEQLFTEKFGDCPKVDIDDQLKWHTLFAGFKAAYEVKENTILSELQHVLTNIHQYGSIGAHKRVISILKSLVYSPKINTEINTILDSYKLSTDNISVPNPIEIQPMSNKEAKLRPIAYYIVNFFKRNPTGKQVDLSSQMSISHRSVKGYIVKLERQNIITRTYKGNFQTTYSVNPETEWNIQ